MVTIEPVFPSGSTLLVIAGPTAVGKTSVAIEVATHFGTEIISADSRQFYHELKIGTAAPSPAQLAAVRHHFVGNLSLSENYNVSRFESAVLNLLPELFSHNNIVIMTGGSGLYIHAVCHGIDELPDVDPELRKQLHSDLMVHGIGGLRSRLKKLDPDYHRIVDPANPNRIIRALEVCLTTGLPYSSFRRKMPAPRPFRCIQICLDLPRAVLHENINQRVDQMMKGGLLDEARSVYHLRHLNALNTVGYKELFQYFDGNFSLEEAVEKIKTNTRRYARRQITWFRRETGMIWCRPDAAEIIRNVSAIL